MKAHLYSSSIVPRFIGGFLAAIALHTIPVFAAKWSADPAAAFRQAAEPRKWVLVNFTGSDWCPYCVKLNAEVFSKPDFGNYVDSRFVLLEVDFPRKKALPAKQQQANDELARRYNVRGFPAVLVLSSDGTKIGELGYAPGGVQAFLSELKRQSGDYTPPSGKPTAAKTAPATGGKGSAVAAVPVAPTLPKDLILKGIIGSKQRAMATINDKTLAIGDEAKIKLDGREVRVRCLDIKDGTVFVTVDDAKEPRELKMSVTSR